MKHLITAFCLLIPLFAQADEPIYPARTYPLASPPAAHQQAARHDTNVATELLAGFASFLVTPVYGAFKLTFAGLGALTGGLAWAFTGGDERVAREIWQTTMGGTYVITPDHLAGREPVRFTGDP